MKSILLINASCNTADIEFNLGLGYIADALERNGYRIRVLCDDIYKYNENDFARALKTGNESVIAISAMYASFKRVIYLVEAIRQYVPEAKIILGGLLASGSPEFLLKKTGADFAVIGPGEYAVVEIADAVYQGGGWRTIANIAYREEDGSVGFTERKSVDIQKLSAEWPAWHLFPMENYFSQPTYYPFTSQDRIGNIITARGCCYSCNFCFNPNPYYQREIGSVLEEMKFLIEKYRITGFYIEDDLLMCSKERVLQFCEGLIKQDIHTKYTVTGRFNIVDREILKLLKETGCVTVFYGAESGNQAILDNMRKKITLEQIREGVRMTREAGIFCRMGFMFGQPGETQQTLRDTISLIKSLAYGNYEERYLYGCIPFPGTALYQYCIERKLLSGDEDFFGRFSFTGRILDQIPVNMTDICGDVNKILKEANRELALFYQEKRCKLK